MNLQLVKIEEGVCSGNVMFHEFITKTEEELKKSEGYEGKETVIQNI